MRCCSSVDTFFFFSGFLAFYSTLGAVMTFPPGRRRQAQTQAAGEAVSADAGAAADAGDGWDGWDGRTAGKFAYAVLLHRFTRLTPMYLFTMMVHIAWTIVQIEDPNHLSDCSTTRSLSIRWP